MWSTAAAAAFPSPLEGEAGSPHSGPRVRGLAGVLHSPSRRTCMPVAVGEPAPDFTATTDEGTQLSLRDLRGRTTVLWFFPKAFTSG